MALVKGSEAAKLEADKIDKEVTNAVLHAEKKVANKNYGYGWSPQLALARRTVTFWRNCLRLHKDGFDPAVVAPHHQRQIPVYDSSGEIIDFRTVSDASEMFQHLIHCNSQHFSQAENTPFVNGIFGKHLHPFQQNEFSEYIGGNN